VAGANHDHVEATCQRRTARRCDAGDRPLSDAP
jgi:hypothetical protein